MKEINYNGPFTLTPEGRMSSPEIRSIVPGQGKVVQTLKEAILKSGLKDGDTISFHHHFRKGDYVLNDVVNEIAHMGYKNLHLAASSLTDIHDPLIGHIENGVITKITTSGLRGDLAEAVSKGLMDEPVVIRSHGGRARAIEAGDIKIDVAFIGAPSSDDYGNIRGVGSKTNIGSMGYAMVDAGYADKVVVVTEDLVPYPNYPASVDQTKVDIVVVVDSIGDQEGISQGATRFSKNPKELMIAENAANFFCDSPYFKNGFSFQTGSGGSSLAFSRFLKERMLDEDVKASFALGGITKAMVELLEQGMVGHLFDTQTFDVTSCNSIVNNVNHHEISASQYANPHNGGCFTNKLNTVVLSALEVDLDFNVNVITGSDGVIRGASGGHSDTAASADMTIIVAPLIRGRLATVKEKVDTIITPGETVDVFVTERGMAINPRRTDLIEHFKDSKLPIVTMEELFEKATEMVGVPKAIEHGDEVVAYVEYRNGTVIDKIYNIR